MDLQGESSTVSWMDHCQDVSFALNPKGAGGPMQLWYSKTIWFECRDSGLGMLDFHGHAMYSDVICGEI